MRTFRLILTTLKVCLTITVRIMNTVLMVNISLRSRGMHYVSEYPHKDRDMCLCVCVCVCVCLDQGNINKQQQRYNLN